MVVFLSFFGWPSSLLLLRVKMVYTSFGGLLIMQGSPYDVEKKLEILMLNWPGCQGLRAWEEANAVKPEGRNPLEKSNAAACGFPDADAGPIMLC